MEPKWDRFAVPGLFRLIAAFQLLTYILHLMKPKLLDHLYLSRDGLLAGEIWRAVTFILLPASSSPIWMIFSLWFLYFIGEGLEHAWGKFRTNFYVLAVLICTNGFVLIFNAFPAVNLLGMGVFFIYALLYPDQSMNFYGIIPVKMKYMAIIDVFFIGQLYFQMPALVLKLGIIAQLLPSIAYILPIGVRFLMQTNQTAKRKMKFQAETSKATFTHQCHACGVTDKDNPDTEFRVSSQDGEDYCVPCLNEIRKR